MTTKPTRQQVVEAYAASRTISPNTASGLADILVRAGLVEEPMPPREKGEYWVKWKDGAKWQKAWFCGINWYPENKYVASEGMAWLSYAMPISPAVIGKRILPPEEE